MPARSKPAPTMSCIWRSTPAPIWHCSTRSSPTSPSRAGIDQDFIANSTFQGDVAQDQNEQFPAALGSFEMAKAECQMSLAEGAEICGVAEADIIKAAEWIAKPHDDGARRKMRHGPTRRGSSGATDNYRTIGALVNIALATGNVGHEGGGVCRSGRPSGGLLPAIRCSCRQAGTLSRRPDHSMVRARCITSGPNDHYKTTLNASAFKREYNRRSNMVKEAMDARAGATREELVDAVVAAIEAGGIFSVNVDIIHTQIGPGRPRHPAGGRKRRDEPHLDEWRAPGCGWSRNIWTRQAPPSPTV